MPDYLFGLLVHNNLTLPDVARTRHGRSYEKQRYSISNVLGEQPGAGSSPNMGSSSATSHSVAPLHLRDMALKTLSSASLAFEDLPALKASCGRVSLLMARLRQFRPKLACVTAIMWGMPCELSVVLIRGVACINCQIIYTIAMMQVTIMR